MRPYETRIEWRIGTSKRSGMTGAGNAPGPGTYGIPSLLVEGPQYFIGAKTGGFLDSHKQVPGPGT